MPHPFPIGSIIGYSRPNSSNFKVLSYSKDGTEIKLQCVLARTRVFKVGATYSMSPDPYDVLIEDPFVTFAKEVMRKKRKKI